MRKHVLITGGAGLIGAHVSNELLKHGYTVRSLDALAPQVHGAERRRPEYLDPAIELIAGDVRDAAILDRIERICHFTALAGAGVHHE